MAIGIRRVFCTRVSGFSSHSLLSVEFDCPDADLSGWRLRIPHKTSKDDGGKALADLGQSSLEFWTSLPQNGEDCCAQEIYDIWLHRFNVWLGTDKAKETSTNCLKGNADYYFDDGLSARLSAKTLSTNWQTQVLKKSKAWAGEIQKHQQNGCEGCTHCTHLRGKLTRLPLKKVAPDLCPPQPLEPQWNERLDVALKQLSRETDKRLNSWRCAIQDSVQHGTKQVFDWLKHGSMPISIVSHLGLRLGAFHVHPPHILSALRQFWEPIFCPDDHQLDPLTIQAAIATLPAAPKLSLSPLTCSDFFRAAHCRSTSSAGLDGIELQELQALPEEAWTFVGLLVEKVEDGQPWPWQLLEVRLAPIPKGEEPGVTPSNKVRLVSISSHIYRSWSWLRTKQASGWLDSITNHEIHVQGRCTFDVLTVTSSQWHLAESNNQALGQLLLDSSKCFDTLSHEALIQIGSELGLPDQISVPFRSFVSCHAR
eukprot:6482064-Amphidinium_carterae.1